MLTLKQCKGNAYIFAQIMKQNIPIYSAVRSINDICGLSITVDDLKKVVRLRAEYYKFDLIFLVEG